jgi:hypothetical protein
LISSLKVISYVYSVVHVVITFTPEAEKEENVAKASAGVREVENWLSPSEAGDILGTSGQWVTSLARKGDLDAVRTSLGWLINPQDVERLAGERLAKAEKKLLALQSAKSRGVAGVRARRSGRGRAKVGGSASG